VPAHRVEDTMNACGAQLGIAAEFFSLPTSVQATLGEGWDARTYIRRVDAGHLDLSKLVELDEVAAGVELGEVTCEAGAQRIQEIDARAMFYPWWLVLFCFGMASASVARFFGGGLNDVLASAVVGVSVGSVMLIAQQVRRLMRVAEFIAGACAAFVAVVCADRFGQLSAQTAMLSGLIALIPGLTLTMAINELSTRNLVAGTARLTGAMMIFLMLGFGVVVGERVASALGFVGSSPGAPLPAWTEWVALLTGTLALVVLFAARPRDTIWVILAGSLGYIAARFGAEILGIEMGVCAGAFVVGIASSLFRRFVNRPSAVMLLPGLMLLVPGSVGFRSLAAFLQDDPLVGIEIGFAVVLIAVSLVTGLLLANVIAPTRRAL
jgi:uncharacterized membrane protein YjjP (DUF1212 family)